MAEMAARRDPWSVLAGEDTLDRELRAPRRALVLCVAVVAALAVAGTLVRVPYEARLVPVQSAGTELLAMPTGGDDPAELVGRSAVARFSGGSVSGSVVRTQTWPPNPGAPTRTVLVIQLAGAAPAVPTSLAVPIGDRSLLADLLIERN